LVPVDMIAFYPTPKVIEGLSPPFLLSVIGTVAVTVGLILARRTLSGPLAAWLGYLGILAPDSGLIRISDQIAADRYSYIAMMGLAILAAGGLGRLWSKPPEARRRRIGTLAIGAVALCVLLGLTREQCRTWKNSKVLWNHAFAHGAGGSW